MPKAQITNSLHHSTYLCSPL